MSKFDLITFEALDRIPDSRQLRCVVYILATSPKADLGVFDVEIVSSTDDLRMTWAMLCAARAELMEQHGFTDADAAQEARP